MAKTQLRQFLGDISAYFVGKLVPGLAFTLFVFCAIKWAGSEAYGQFGLVYSTAIFLSALCIGWFNQAQLRASNDTQGLVGVVRKQAISLAVLSVCVISAVCWGVSQFRGADQVHVAIIAGALALVHVGYLVKLVSMQSSLQASGYRSMEVVRAVVLLVGVAWLGLVSSGYWQLLAIVSLSFLLPALLVGWKRAQLEPVPEFGLKKSFSFGWPVALWLALITLLPVFERWLILLYFDDASLGSYSSLYDIVVRGLALLLMPVTLALHPRYMAAINAGKYREGQGYLRWSWLGAACLVLLTAIACLLGAERLLYLILPEIDVQATGTYFWPLVFAALLWQLALLAHKPLEAAGKTSWMFFMLLFVMSLVMLFDWLLISNLGVIALPLGSCAGALVYLSVCFIMARNSVNGQKVAVAKPSSIQG